MVVYPNFDILLASFYAQVVMLISSLDKLLKQKKKKKLFILGSLILLPHLFWLIVGTHAIHFNKKIPLKVNFNKKTYLLY